MPPKRQVYLLDAQKLSAETIAVTFAKTSRSPQSFQEIAAELTDEKSAQFHEKWVVGYGHASVAEHAVLHLALEGISRLSTEVIQSSRLASFTEKSTRYQIWGKKDYCLPPEIMGSAHQKLFSQEVENLFSTYLKIVPKVIEWNKTANKKEPCESDVQFDQRIKVMAIDACRFLLPAAASANVGMTINARGLEHLLCKLLSHPLAEVRQIGEEMRSAAMVATPTLIKYARENTYMRDACHALMDFSSEISSKRMEDQRCRLVDWDQEGERNILAAVLFRTGSMDYDAAFEYTTRMGEVELTEFAERTLSPLTAHDRPMRELEYANLTFALTMDQGAFYEFKRHRMMTLTTQRLSTDIGYEIPQVIVDSGCLSEYIHAMENARKAYERVFPEFPEAASYVVPNGFLRRILIKLNLREAFHLISLRASPKAHFSIRFIAQLLAEEIIKVYPHIGRYLPVNEKESAQTIRAQYFSRKG